MPNKIQDFLKTENTTQKTLPALNTDFRVGDNVKVHQLIKEVQVHKKLSKTAKAIQKAESQESKNQTERIQVFEGTVIAKKHGLQAGATFTVRKIAAGGITVEKIFPLYSPTIKKIEIVSRPKIRRAKLYFMRKRIGKAAKRAGLGVAVEQAAPADKTSSEETTTGSR